VEKRKKSPTERLGHTESRIPTHMIPKRADLCRERGGQTWGYSERMEYWTGEAKRVQEEFGEKRG